MFNPMFDSPQLTASTSTIALHQLSIVNSWPVRVLRLCSERLGAESWVMVTGVDFGQFLYFLDKFNAASRRIWLPRYLNSSVF